MKRNFAGLDLLRFALACYLMVFHSIHRFPHSEHLPFIALAGLGGFATSTFFVLSGFILAPIAAVYFQERCVVALRDKIRHRLLDRGRRLARP